MSKQPWTPGPWSQGRTLVTPETRGWSPKQVARNDEYEHLRVYAFFTAEDQGRGRVCVATCDNPNDARLIASAPELYEALYALWDWVWEDNRGDGQYPEEKVRAALAKARGETP